MVFILVFFIIHNNKQFNYFLIYMAGETYSLSLAIIAQMFPILTSN